MSEQCLCGSTEYITAPNFYDAYEYIKDEGKFVFWRAESTDGFKLFCRECGTEVFPPDDSIE